jgi:O-antigen/teichoic acid export membrane protein
MISIFVYTKINQLIVFRYCGQAPAGIFAVALTLALYLMLIPEVFQTALYPRVIHSDDDYEITVRALRFGFYGWGAIAVLAMLFAKPLLLVYGGKDFLASVRAFRMLMVAVWFLPLSSFINPYYVKKGAFGLGAICAVTLGIISVIMNLFLVPGYASTGAAAATSITCLIGFCMSLLLFYYLSKRNPLAMFKPVFK